MERCVFILVLLAVLFLPGCLYLPYGGVVNLEFSPDGESAAYTVHEGAIVLLLPFGRKLESGYVRWVDTRHPGSVRSLQLYQGWGGLSCGYMPPPGQMAFSPDGRRLAFVLLDKIQILDTQDGKCFTLTTPGGRDYMAWLNDTELAYLGGDTGANATDSFICVQTQTADPNSYCREVFRTPGCTSMGRTGWSPSGRYVVIPGVAKTYVSQGPCTIFDVKECRTVATLDATGRLDSVAWASDGSGVLCVFNQYGEPADYPHRPQATKAVYYSLKTSTLKRYCWTRPPNDAHWNMLGFRWTAGNRYLIVEVYEPQGNRQDLILDPETGELISLEKGLKALLPELKEVRLEPLQIAGWLAAVCHNDKAYAVDQDLRVCSLLTTRPRWWLSPDRKRIAEIGLWGNVEIRNLSLPERHALPTAVRQE